MKVGTALKLGQIVGAILMAAGVAGCTMRTDHFALYFLAGGLIYAGCRIAAWLRED